MRDKGRVESGVKYVQGSFFAGESFLDLADARSRMAGWLAGTANARVHGTTRQVPAVVFAAREAGRLLPAPGGRYQVPYWAQVKVHVDYHIQVARALYSVPWRHAGARVMARADEHLVKIYLRDQLIRTHPRKPPGGRSTDVSDMPPGVEGYATRNADRIAAQAGCYGEHVGAYARRLLDGDQPWMMMRSAYRLIGLAKRYGAGAADAACARALDVDVISVSRIESMLKNATGNAPAMATAAGLAPAAGGVVVVTRMMEARAVRLADHRWVITVARSWSRGDRVLAPKSGWAWLRGVRETGGRLAWCAVRALRSWSKSWLVMPVRVGWDSQPGAWPDGAAHAVRRVGAFGGGGGAARGWRA